MWLRTCWKPSSPRSPQLPHLVFNLRSEHWHESISEPQLCLAHFDHKLGHAVAGLFPSYCCFNPQKCSVFTYSWSLEIGNDGFRQRNRKQLSLPKHPFRYLVHNPYNNCEKAGTSSQIVITSGREGGRCAWGGSNRELSDCFLPGLSIFWFLT